VTDETDSTEGVEKVRLKPENLPDTGVDHPTEN